MKKIRTFFILSDQEKVQLKNKYFQVTPNVCICEDFIVTLKSDGTVIIPNNIVTHDHQWNNIVKICSGSNHVVGLKADGKVLACGDNTLGQCEVSDWKDIRDIFAKDNVTIGITYKDEVHIAGSLEKHSAEYENELKKLQKKIDSLHYFIESISKQLNDLKNNTSKANNSLELRLEDINRKVERMQDHTLKADCSLALSLKDIDSRVKDLENAVYSYEKYDQNKIVSSITSKILSTENRFKNYKTDKYVGKRLDSRYEIQELIDEGIISRVYKAYDIIDDRKVALKIFNEEFLKNEEFIRNLKHASEKISVLSHPNIIKVYDISVGDRIQYMVMEYLDGVTLKEYIDVGTVLWKEAVHFIVQILKALQHAHEKGIIHEYINSSNIMLLQDGTVKILNFGIPQCLSNTMPTDIYYISPEQARGGITDLRTDIYSVGVMLYKMLTGKYPFSGDNAVYIAIMKLQNDPEPIRKINANIPEMLEEITLKAMSKNPDDRFASAQEMLDAIEKFKQNPNQKLSDVIKTTNRLSKDTENTIDKSENKKSSFWNKHFGGF